MRGVTLLALIFTLSHNFCFADGVFVFRWNKQIDINEPTQKAIILHDKGQEDLVLQVKYEGPAEEFGWLVPVPGLPEVRKGSMDACYELSRLTQERMGTRGRAMTKGVQSAGIEDDSVKVIEIKTVGAYEVAILSAGNAAKLTEWLDANDFVFPKEKQDVVDAYVKNQWYFVAAKIDPNQSGFVVRQGSPKKGIVNRTIPAATRRRLASGELHPLIISFPSAKCVFPLAISAANGKPSEISLYVLSAEPLMSRVIFDKKFAAYSRERMDWIKQAPERRKRREEMRKNSEKRLEELLAQLHKEAATNSRISRNFPDWNDDPADPQPRLSAMRQMRNELKSFEELPDEFSGGGQFVWSMEATPANLAACAKLLPRLSGKSWWLAKQVQTFTPDEMRDLDFEPAIPVLAEKLRTPDGQIAATCLAQFGARALPVVVAAAKSADPNQRRFAASALERMHNQPVAAVIPELLADADARARLHAVYAAAENWDASFAPRLVQLFRDSDGDVRSAAGFVMGQHRDDSLTPICRKMVEEDGVAAAQAIGMLDITSLSRAELIHLFSSTNLPVVSTAFARLRYSLTVDELAPLLTNSLPMARLISLGELARIGDKAAVDRIVAMLRDPNEVVRWGVRARLRLLTGQKLGADPAAYEKWWAQNREMFTPRPSVDPRLERRRPVPSGEF